MSHDIENLLSQCKCRILTYAEAALPESQFKAFRKLVLDEFGKRGLVSDLEQLFINSKREPER